MNSIIFAFLQAFLHTDQFTLTKDKYLSHLIKSEKLIHAIHRAAQFLTDFDLDFYRRVWATDLDIYRRRLKMIQFVGLDKVLDAGCGNGQWTLCLCESNKYVFGIDVSDTRVKATEVI